MNSRITLPALLFTCVTCIGTAHAQDAAPGVPEAAPADPKPYIHWSDNSLTLLPYGQGFEVEPDEQDPVGWVEDDCPRGLTQPHRRK